MIPCTLNSETHITEIVIQNEFKTTEIKKPVNNSITSVKYSELLRQENAENNKNPTRNTADSNAQKCGKLFTVNHLNRMEIGDTNIRKEGLSNKNKKPGVYPTKYWVQYTTQVAADEPMEYTPDRNSFVAKVFSLTFVMLVITSGFVTIVFLSDGLREIFLDTQLGKLLVVAAAAGMLLLNYKIMCSACMRVFPCNFITLIIAVVCMSIITAYITASHNTTMIVYALIATAVTVLVCFLLALTRFDFTKYVLYVFVVGVVLCVLSIIVFVGTLITGIRFKPLELVILFIGTLVNVVVLIMELQMILGGKTVSLSENDYALGAFMLYVSIVDLFLKLLQMIGITLDEDSEFFSDIL